MADDICSWDGKERDTILSVYNARAQDKGFIASLIALFTDSDTQIGATWLFKKACEDKHPELSGHTARGFYETLVHVTRRDAKLHVLQAMPYVAIPPGCRDTLETFVREAMTSEAKFVRAWAYDGFYRLAIAYPELQDEAVQTLQNALDTDPSAAVKARVRKILTQAV